MRLAKLMTGATAGIADDGQGGAGCPRRRRRLSGPVRASLFAVAAGHDFGHGLEVVWFP